MTALLRSLGLSLGLTLLLELGAALLLGLRKPRDLVLVGLVNALTNPIVVLILGTVALRTRAAPPWYLVAGLELAAVAAEGCLYRHRLEYRRIPPLILSLLLNALSYLGGLLL